MISQEYIECILGELLQSTVDYQSTGTFSPLTRPNDLLALKAIPLKRQKNVECSNWPRNVQKANWPTLLSSTRDGEIWVVGVFPILSFQST